MKSKIVRHHSFRLVFVLGFGFLLLQSCGPPTAEMRNKTDREIDGLKGPVKTAQFFPANGGQAIAKYTYNAEGARTEDLLFDEKGKLRLKRIYAYDENDKLKETIIYNEAGEIAEKIVPTQEMSGKPPIDLLAQADGELPANRNYVWEEYDAHQNWTKRTLWLNLSKYERQALRMDYRSIDYYEEEGKAAPSDS
ncbi:MAG: hypothetical protein AB1656_24830 [Candidatus Omnitrophota bacterium]